MSEELKLKLKFRALGLLSASAIGGEACKDCPHNIPRMSAALLTGDGEALRDCAKLLFKDCELLPLGTKARIAELEQKLEQMRTVALGYYDMARRLQESLDESKRYWDKALVEARKLTESSEGD